MFHRTAGVAITAAFLLAQVGEFSFVLEQTGRAAGLSPAGVGASGSQAFIATAVLLFVLTPVLDTIGRRAGKAVAARKGGEPEPTAVPAVVVLANDEATFQMVASSVDAAGLDNPVTRWDPATLEHGELAPARLIVAVDAQRDVLEQVLDLASRHDPATPTLAWVVDPDHADQLVARDDVDVIDAGGAVGVTVAFSTLRVLGVDASVRGDALTAALEHLPAELRRPIA
jgi:hypothetical protein